MIKCPECGEHVPREQICELCGCCRQCCECEIEIVETIDDGILEAT